MATIRLKPGDRITVVAQDPSLVVGGGPMPGGDLGLGHPEHPIVLPPDPTQPLPPHPDQTLPGDLPRPDQGLPGSQPRPDQGLPPFPSHPIVLPPPGEIPPPIEPGTTPNWELKVAWTPVTGWVVVAIPTGPHPTPSRKK